MKTDKYKEWENEFTKKFIVPYVPFGKDNKHIPSVTRPVEVKEFIRNLLASQKTEILDGVIDLLKSLEVDLIETTSHEYDQGWHDCNLKWDLKLVDIEKKLSDLRNTK